MFATLGGVFLGFLVGLKHAFEPDHLTAVTTMVAQTGGVRRGALLGAVWGLGHTLALVAVGVVLLALGVMLPDDVVAGFEAAVGVMLVGLGVHAIRRALRDGDAGPVTHHQHGALAHTHAAPAHIHVGSRTLSWRPLAIGLVHGMAGSGALTALVFARLSGTAERLVYMALFGLGSVLGMAIASAMAGAAAQFARRGARTRRALELAAGALSLVVGVVWAIPALSVLG